MSKLRLKPAHISAVPGKWIVLKERALSGELVSKRFRLYSVQSEKPAMTAGTEGQRSDEKKVILENKLMVYKIVSLKGSSLYVRRDDLPENGVIALKMSAVVGELFWIGDTELRMCVVVSPVGAEVEWISASTLEAWDKDGTLVSSAQCPYTKIAAEELPLIKLLRVADDSGTDVLMSFEPTTSGTSIKPVIWPSSEADSYFSVKTPMVDLGARGLYNWWVRKEDLTVHPEYSDSLLMGARVLLSGTYDPIYNQSGCTELEAENEQAVWDRFEALITPSATLPEISRSITNRNQLTAFLSNLPNREDLKKELESIRSAPILLDAYLAHPLAIHRQPLFAEYVKRFGFVFTTVMESLRANPEIDGGIQILARGAQQLSLTLKEETLVISTTISTGYDVESRTKCLLASDFDKGLLFALKKLENTSLRVAQLLGDRRPSSMVGYRKAGPEVRNVTTIFCVYIGGYLWPVPSLHRQIDDFMVVDDDIPF